MRWAISAISEMPSSLEFELYAFRLEKGLVLLYQRILRLGKDPEKVILVERPSSTLMGNLP